MLNTHVSIQAALLEADPDLADLLRCVFGRVDIPLAVVHSVPALLQHADRCGPHDVLILDCSRSRAEDLRNCITVVKQTRQPVHIIAPTDDLVLALRSIAHGPLVWLPADFGQLMPLFTKLRLLKLQATAQRDEDQYQCLSRREREVFALVAQVKSYAEIARKLGISVPAVKTYVQRIKEKLEISTLDELKAASRRMTGG